MTRAAPGATLPTLHEVDGPARASGVDDRADEGRGAAGDDPVGGGRLPADNL